MKIISSAEKNYIPKNSFKPTDPHIKNWTREGLKELGNENNSNLNENKNISTTKILTTNEMSMLHLLFGSDKPDEMTFYGPNKVQQINKGQLIDIIG
ncbi:MAG: hypothetical protein P9X24_01975 [Candidatus Hatepunaea meridiana]|nr:hypothetical protein [Candidatus Hatepunaea meridiana]